jgi:hypothetical protein
MSGTVIEGGHARRLFVVANGSHGKAWMKRLGESGYDAVLAWDAPDARRSDAAQGEDRPGRAFPAAGATQRSAMEREGKDDGPKEHAKRDLARRMAQDMLDALQAGTADSLVLVAPAPFAAAVLGHIPHDRRHVLVGTEHHDLTGLPTAELFDRLDALRHGM